METKVEFQLTGLSNDCVDEITTRFLSDYPNSVTQVTEDEDEETTSVIITSIR